MRRPTISEPAVPNPFSLPNHQAKPCSGGVLSAVRSVVAGWGKPIGASAERSGDVPPDQQRTRAMLRRLPETSGVLSHEPALGIEQFCLRAVIADRLHHSSEDAPHPRVRQKKV